MDEPVEQYLDRVLRHSSLPRGQRRIVKAELKDHIVGLIELSGLHNPSEIYTMLEKEFGNPRHIGNAIAATRRRFTDRKRWIIRIAVAALVILSVKVAVAEGFYAATDAAAPLIPAGSRCLVYKRPSNIRPGDVIVFRPGAGREAWLGIVKETGDGSDHLIVRRNARPDVVVSKSEIVGRVVANTR